MKPLDDLARSWCSWFRTRVAAEYSGLEAAILSTCSSRRKALAGYVLAEAKDGYAVVFSLGELDPDLGGARIIVADKLDSKPLFEYQGPLRLVIPADKEGARSVPMLERLEVASLRK